MTVDDGESGQTRGGTEHLSFVTESADETRGLGEILGRAAVTGDVLLLRGAFGAGKTVFVQGVAQGLDVPGPVTSPSFVLAAEHHGRLPLFHIDLFRVDAPEEDLIASLHEYLEGEGVCAIEWPERLPLPHWLNATEIDIDTLDDCRRSVDIRTPVARLAAALRTFRSLPTAALEGASPRPGE